MKERERENTEAIIDEVVESMAITGVGKFAAGRG